MGAAAFSRASSPGARTCCPECCKTDRADDDSLSRASVIRIKSLTGQKIAPDAPAGVAGPTCGNDATPCEAKACKLAPVLQRFNRYREALPFARAAADLNELGDAPGDTPSTKPCLTRLPVDADGLDKSLGLPAGSLHDEDLRNDQTGFRAAMYRDESTGQLILVPRDTQPDSLVDWQTNTRNGSGEDTKQYAAMRQLTGTLSQKGVDFDIAGYSKGAGLAQEGGLLSDGQVRLFNAAGLPDASLARTGAQDFDSLVSRTKAFSTQGDFITFMTQTTDPAQQITNARFLRRELAGEGPGLNPIDIKVRNPAMRGQPDPDFDDDKTWYLGELDARINDMQRAFDDGLPIAGFPPVRAPQVETINDSSSLLGRLLGAGSDQPTLGKLAQHKMGQVLDSLESNVKRDRDSLLDFASTCG